MNTFLAAAAGFVMVTVVIGLVRILYGPGDADRVMAAQLIGSGGVATLLLASTAAARPAVVDVALVLALLAAFTTIAFVLNAAPASDGAPPRDDPGSRGAE